MTIKVECPLKKRLSLTKLTILKEVCVCIVLLLTCSTKMVGQVKMSLGAGAQITGMHSLTGSFFATGASSNVLPYFGINFSSYFEENRFVT